MIGKRIGSGSPFEEMACYPRAVIDGDMVHLSGTTGYDFKNKCYPDNAEDQALAAFSVIANTLEQAGTSLENMLRIRIYVATRAEFERIKPIIRSRCEPAKPANTTIIFDLVEEVMRVEFEVTAKII